MRKEKYVLASDVQYTRSIDYPSPDCEESNDVKAKSLDSAVKLYNTDNDLHCNSAVWFRCQLNTDQFCLVHYFLFSLREIMGHKGEITGDCRGKDLGFGKKTHQCYMSYWYTLTCCYSVILKNNRNFPEPTPNNKSLHLFSTCRINMPGRKYNSMNWCVKL